MRKKNLMTGLCHGLAAMMLGLCMLAGAAFPCAAAESYYVENNWNFVDASMPVTGGIPEDAQGLLGQIGRNGVLRVATDAVHPPRTFLDPEKSGQDRFAGADMELARYIAKRMGVELVIVELEPERVLPSLLNGMCDLAISSIDFTPSRALSYTMSRSYDHSEPAPVIGVLVSGNSPIVTLKDLEGKTVIAQRNSLAETVAVKEGVEYLEFLRASVAQKVGMALEAGQADAAFVDVQNSAAFFEKNPDTSLRLVEGLEFTPDEIYLGKRVATHKGEIQLMYFVNGVIEEVLEKNLYETWLQEAAARADVAEGEP